MDTLPNQIFFPVHFNEFFSIWNRFPHAVVYAGGSDLIRKQGKNIINLPKVVLCLDKLSELHRITRTEHYLEIGSMTRLNRLITLGKAVPQILRMCLEKIGGVQLRNIATIGGNICSSARLFDLSAPLTALDAQYEFRGISSTRWVSAARFHSEDNTTLDNQEILTRIRLPLHQWDYAIFFLAKTQKNILGDIRIVYKTDMIWRDRDSESILIGKKFPLNQGAAADFTGKWESFLCGIPNVDELSRKELMNFIKINIHNLSE
jgi:CO/xanthine dehydrogenase FAD-binding subunit